MNHWKKSCSVGDGPAQLLSVRALELVLYIYYIHSVDWGREGRYVFRFFVHFLNGFAELFCIYSL